MALDDAAAAARPAPSSFSGHRARVDVVRLRIDLAYDGATFTGYARQAGQRTVQGDIEAALAKVLHATEVDTVCAGRTDKGVHAEAQTIHVDVPSSWPRLQALDRLRRDLDNMLGQPISIQRVRRVPSSFDARRSATERRYRYRLWDRPVIPPLLHHDTWHVPSALDVETMDRAAQVLLGTHDFDSFCRKRIVRLGDGREVEAPLTRRVHAVSVAHSRPAGLVLLRVSANAFCHQMIRAITGSLVEVGRGRQSEAWFRELLEARDRTFAGPVAPPQGLSLVGVSYRPRAVPESAPGGCPGP